jgi:large subunit ribosomal protein L49
MARGKGWRVLRKAAEEFTNFQPPKTSTKIKVHPNLLALHDRMSQTPKPLKYKLHEMPSAENSITQPLGPIETLPFQISRTHTGNLPIYTDYRNDRTRKLTIIRRISGDINDFKEELAKVVSNAPISEKVGRLEVKGLHKPVIEVWLRRLGF